MERIMSLKNGLKKRTPIWCWLMIVALAFVVLPGAVAQPSVDEVAPNETNRETEILQKDDVVAPLPGFEGNEYWNDADLRRHLSNREQTEDTDRATTLDADRESIKSKYCEVGFFDVEVTANTSSADDPTNRKVRFEIKEGDRYTIRQIRYEGNNRINASDLQQGSNLKLGDKYSAFETSKDIQRIRELYKGSGVEPAVIKPVPHFIEERGIFDLVFEIDENPAAIASGNDAKTNKSTVTSVPQVEVSSETYKASDLFERLAEEHGLSPDDARKFLISIFERALPPVMELPHSFPAPPKVAAAQSLPAPPAPRQLSSISFDGDQLIVVQSDVGHEKLKEKIDRFRKFGFKRFQVTARFIMGSADEINTLMSSLEMEAPFSNIARAPVHATQHNAADGVKPEQSAITKIQMGVTGFVSRDKVRAIEEQARSKTDCLLVECAQVQSFNGQAAMTHVGETKPYIIGFNENGEPMIRTVTDGLTLHVTPTVVEEGMLRLQCVSSMEAISKTQTVFITRSAGKSPQRIPVPEITSKRVQTTVDLKEDQTLWLSGLTATEDGKKQAALVVLEVTPISLQHYLVDQPLLDIINTVVEPHGFQFAIGKEEVVLTAKPQDQPGVETPESAPLQNSDIIMVTRKGSEEAVQAKPTDAVKVHRIAVGGNSELVGTFIYEEPRGKSGEPDGHANSSTIQAAPYESIVSSERRLSPGMAPKESAIIPDLDMPPAIQQSSDPLVKQVWQMRESIRKRLLSTNEYTPWQIMQGLNGLRRDFDLKHQGKVVNGLEWIQTGPMFEDEPWFQKTALDGQAHPYSKPYAFQGHINQFAAILAMCDIPADAQFGTPDGPITMADMVEHAQMTANETEEVCWTLQLLCKYLPPHSEWVNAKGEKWSMERLVKTTMLKATASGAPNGGTFGLFTLAVARDEYQRTGMPLGGVWLEAEKMIQQHIQIVHDQQNPNGTLSSNFFRGREEKKDFDKRLASSGALLGFLLMAVSDEQLKEDWVRQAVTATVKDLDDNRKSFVSCSPLFKATNALSIFLERAAAASEVVKSRPKAKDVAPEARFVLCAYPVADLVVYRQPVFATIGRSTAAVGPVQQSEITARSVVITLAKSADQAEAKPKPAPQEPNAFSLNAKAYFAPLTELIKATVQPDSWAPLGAGTIAIEEKLLCLVISQTAGVHGEICDLLSQLRKADDHMISITTQIVKLSDDAHVEWLGTHCSLHPLADGTQWGLLPQHRSEVFTQEWLGRKSDVLSAPKVSTISGQTATIQVGQTNTEDDTPTGIRLEMTPHLLPDTKVFRLQHAVQIGKLSAEVLRPVESLVGSGQTLVLLMSGSAGIENSETGKSQYLLLLTPEYVSLADEESAVHPESDANHPTKR